MSDLPTVILFWNWLILGLVLLGIEILVSGFFCLWLGIAALATGFVVWLVPSLSWPVQAVIFSALSLVAVGLWLRYRPFADDRLRTDSSQVLNERGRQLVGQVYTLVEPIHNGVGKARVQDSVWRVTGADLASGSRVRVVGVDGSTLKVETVA